MTDELYELALRALTTPSLDAPGSLVELQRVLSYANLASDLHEAHAWAKREVRPKFLDAEGSWPVEIVDVHEHENFRIGRCVVVRFKLATSPRVYAYVVCLKPHPLGWSIRFSPDARLGPVLKAGRGRLETKRMTTKEGKVYVHHKWSV